MRRNIVWSAALAALLMVGVAFSVRYWEVLTSLGQRSPAASATLPTFEVSGWVPYWAASAGVATALQNIDTITEVNPFVYTVKSDGTLVAEVDFSDPTWAGLRYEAGLKHVRFVPSIIWNDGPAIDAVLRNPTLRALQVKTIVSEVLSKQFDGIDIDYEGKLPQTAPYFSLFLKELSEALPSEKWLMCSVLARTPPESFYGSREKVPLNLAYADDFKQLNTYCDRVRIMAYDQQRADMKLNAANPDPYAPVASLTWVESVMRIASLEINSRKLVMGVATYGWEYEMYPTQWYMGYDVLSSFNPSHGVALAALLGVSPVRTEAGELMLTYPVSTSGSISSVASSAIATTSTHPHATRVLVWSDSVAIKQKLDLARSLGLRGVAIFKVDGGEDANLWGLLQEYSLAASRAGLAASDRSTKNSAMCVE